MIIHNTHQLYEEYYPDNNSNKGKLSKIIRNKNNPKKIKTKYNGKSNPFKKISPE